MLADVISYSLNGLNRRALRSLLTIIGVVIGITAIIVLMSLGQGVSNAVNKELDSFGSNTIIIVPGQPSGGSPLSPTAGKLYESDVQRLGKVDGINLITSTIIGRVSVDYKGNSAQISMIGIEPKSYRESVAEFEIAKGRFLESNDRQVIVIGDNIAKELFKKEIFVGSVVTIRGKPFRVIGIIAPVGGSGFFPSEDNSVYIPIDDLREFVKSSMAENEISSIYVEIKKDYDMKEAEEEIKQTLRSAHRVKEGEEDFYLLTQEFIVERIGAITGALTLFLGGLGLISLLVGGVTVANTLFASVIERFREIGTLKSLGATNRFIFTIFLFESVVLTAIGGVLGSIIATLLLLGMQTFGAPIWLSWELYAGAMAFSVLVGVASGFFPAVKAAMLPPVEALRYE